MVERGRNFSNMSKEECEALRDLKSYKDVVFKKLAYKESAVQWFGVDFYRKEA